MVRKRTLRPVLSSIFNIFYSPIQVWLSWIGQKYYFLNYIFGQFLAIDKLEFGVSHCPLGLFSFKIGMIMKLSLKICNFKIDFPKNRHFYRSLIRHSQAPILYKVAIDSNCPNSSTMRLVSLDCIIALRGSHRKLRFELFQRSEGFGSR